MAFAAHHPGLSVLQPPPSHPHPAALAAAHAASPLLLRLLPFPASTSLLSKPDLDFRTRRRGRRRLRGVLGLCCATSAQRALGTVPVVTGPSLLGWEPLSFCPSPSPQSQPGGVTIGVRAAVTWAGLTERHAGVCRLVLLPPPWPLPHTCLPTPVGPPLALSPVPRVSRGPGPHSLQVRPTQLQSPQEGWDDVVPGSSQPGPLSVTKSLGLGLPHFLPSLGFSPLFLDPFSHLPHPQWPPLTPAYPEPGPSPLPARLQTATSGR